MKTLECPRELETLEIVRAGRPLDLHARTCEACAELALVAAAFVADYHDAVRAAPVPASGAVWWRVQRRMREEALRSASRTVTCVEVASVAAALLLAVTLLGGAESLGWAEGIAASVRLEPLMAVATGPLLLVAATWLLLAPVALYFSVRD